MFLVPRAAHADFSSRFPFIAEPGFSATKQTTSALPFLQEYAPARPAR
jgi:hypothetical protein